MRQNQRQNTEIHAKNDTGLNTDAKQRRFSIEVLWLITLTIDGSGTTHVSCIVIVVTGSRDAGGTFEVS